MKKIANYLVELKNFSKLLDLVEFGNVKRSDDHIPHKGVTMQKRFMDHYYSFGNVKGRDIAIVLREFSFSMDKKDNKSYTWVVMATKLNVYDVPYIFIDSHQADNDLYLHMINVVGKMTHVSDVLKKANPSFTAHWHVFSKLQDSYLLDHFLQDSITQGLYERFQDISFEAEDDYLYTYIDAKYLSKQKLQQMLDSCLWLAEHFEYADAELQGLKES